ncbi:hypothetical protein TWF694_001502 [Orbilia ellipsospora]|uniref:Uncharacterized protein n=1 Tax=Orbilia ellipsospora TaxID=2528407 RepID=A0AAV9XS63_9PEZI
MSEPCDQSSKPQQLQEQKLALGGPDPDSNISGNWDAEDANSMPISSPLHLRDEYSQMQTPSVSEKQPPPFLPYVAPSDALPYLKRQIKHYFFRARSRVKQDVLFEISKPADSGVANNLGVEKICPPIQNQASTATSTSHGSNNITSKAKFQVKSSTLASMISLARGMSFISARRLGHRSRKDIRPHKDSVFGETILMRLCNLDLSLQSGGKEKEHIYQIGADACKVATEAIIGILTGIYEIYPSALYVVFRANNGCGHHTAEALMHYEQDPDILWSLWLHQNISFARHYPHIFLAIGLWEQVFRLPGLPGRTEFYGKMYPKHILENIKVAKSGYKARVRKFTKKTS